MTRTQTPCRSRNTGHRSLLIISIGHSTDSSVYRKWHGVSTRPATSAAHTWDRNYAIIFPGQQPCKSSVRFPVEDAAALSPRKKGRKRRREDNFLGKWRCKFRWCAATAFLPQRFSRPTQEVARYPRQWTTNDCARCVSMVNVRRVLMNVSTSPGDRIRATILTIRRESRSNLLDTIRTSLAWLVGDRCRHRSR